MTDAVSCHAHHQLLGDVVLLECSQQKEQESGAVVYVEESSSFHPWDNFDNLTNQGELLHRSFGILVYVVLALERDDEKVHYWVAAGADQYLLA